MASFRKLEWLFPIAVTLHNSEEAVWMPAWLSRHPLPLPFPSPGAREIRFALAVLTVAAFAVTYFARRSGKQSLWSYLAFGYIVAMLVNVFVPHVPATLAYRAYTPGVVTAVFVNLPLMSFLAFLSLREDWVRGARAVVFAIGVPLAIGGIISVLFLVGGAI